MANHVLESGRRLIMQVPVARCEVLVLKTRCIPRVGRGIGPDQRALDLCGLRILRQSLVGDRKSSPDVAALCQGSMGSLRQVKKRGVQILSPGYRPLFIFEFNCKATQVQTKSI